MTHAALRATAHRPEPLPTRPWCLSMQWHDLALLHWPVSAAALQRLLPADLEVDTFDGTAWLGIVPFVMRRVRPRWLPPLPGAGTFCELNVRTYVRRRGVPGVWFFSLDAASKLAVRGARAGFALPYFGARMRCERRGERIDYASERTHRGAPPAVLRARWDVPTTFAEPARGTPAHWFVERYRMYVPARGAGGAARVGHIAHAPWRLAATAVELLACDLTRLCGLDLTGPPAFAHAAAPLAVVGWLPSRD